MPKRLANFGAGPAVLPEEVLNTLSNNLLSYKDTGIGVMELSHRSKEFEAIINETEERLRRLLNISSSYAVLFTTGGASTQFSAVPMNLLHPGTTANFIISGFWAKAALEETKKFGNVHVAASSEADGYRSLPSASDLTLSSETPAYLHFTSNNTLYGTQFSSEPEAGNIELVCDASSDFLHKKIDINKYGLIYAGAQKNLGPAGVTLVIVKRELIGKSTRTLPLMLDYATYATHKSLYNTPPTFAIYVVGEVLRWIEDLGGLDTMFERNKSKAAPLYQLLDQSSLYQPVAKPQARSLMNVTFSLSDSSLEDKFLAESVEAGLIGLKGHRLVGGFRASLYNALPPEDVLKLVDFMQTFEANA